MKSISLSATAIDFCQSPVSVGTLIPPIRIVKNINHPIHSLLQGVKSSSGEVSCYTTFTLFFYYSLSLVLFLAHSLTTEQQDSLTDTLIQYTYSIHLSILTLN